MNETLFLIHVLLVIAFGFGAMKLGKAALTAWIALQAVLANLFVIKQISFFGFHATCSDVFAIGSVFGLNLLREYYGKDDAKRALWSCFFTMAFFVAMSQIHLFYQPNSFDTSQPAFDAILSSSPRILLASLTVFFVVQQIDLRFFGYLKEKFHFIPLSVRNAVSLIATQTLDTVLFPILGLWGLVENLSDVIVVGLVVKLVIIALMTPLIQFSKRFVPYKIYERI